MNHSWALFVAAIAGVICAARTTAGAETAYFTNGPSLQIPRYLHAVTLLQDGRVLVVGGITGTSSNNAEVFDPNKGTWTFVGPNGPDYGHTATLLPDGRVLVVFDNSAQIFDPVSETWTTTGALQFGRRSHRSTLLKDGRVLVTGGYLTPTRCEVYSPNSGTWTTTADLKAGSVAGTALVLPSGKVLVLGDSAVQLYDPATDSWTLRTPLPPPSSAVMTGTLLANGLILVTSGSGNPGYYSPYAFLYDPVNDIWRATARPSDVRYQAVLLRTGKVLSMGRISTELYDPLAHAWTTGGPLTTNRDFYTATTLQDGRVFVVAGGMASAPFGTTEFYTSTNISFFPLLLSAPRIVGGSMSFTFSNVPSIGFGVQAARSLSEEWYGLDTLAETDPGSYRFTDPVATNGQRFYRVKAP